VSARGGGHHRYTQVRAFAVRGPLRESGAVDRATHDKRGTTMSSRGSGSAFFASILLMVAGTVNIIYGIAAISDSKFFVGQTRYVFSSLHTWGWVTLLLGILAIIAGLSVVRGGVFGRTIGIFVAGLAAIGALLGVGGTYPFWSLGVFAMCIVIIHGLAVYNPEAAADTARAR